jgi:hypothetical protein
VKRQVTEENDSCPECGSTYLVRDGETGAVHWNYNFRISLSFVGVQESSGQRMRVRDYAATTSPVLKPRKKSQMRCQQHSGKCIAAIT